MGDSNAAATRFEKKVIQQNIRTEVQAGKKPNQAAAIAYKKAGKYRPKGRSGSK